MYRLKEVHAWKREFKLVWNAFKKCDVTQRGETKQPAATLSVYLTIPNIFLGTVSA